VQPDIFIWYFIHPSSQLHTNQQNENPEKSLIVEYPKDDLN